MYIWVIIAIKQIFSRLPVAWILRGWSNNNRELNLIDQLMTQEVLGNRTSWPFSFSQAPGFHIGLHSIRDAEICLQNWFKSLPKIEKKGEWWLFKFILKIMRILGYQLCTYSNLFLKYWDFGLWKNILFWRHCSFIS